MRHSIYLAVLTSRKIPAMAELYLSAIKSARVFPNAGWAALVYGKSSHGLWMLDKSALFIHKSLKKNQLCIFRCDGNPLLLTKKRAESDAV